MYVAIISLQYIDIILWNFLIILGKDIIIVIATTVLMTLTIFWHSHEFQLLHLREKSK